MIIEQNGTVVNVSNIDYLAKNYISSVNNYTLIVYFGDSNVHLWYDSEEEANMVYDKVKEFLK